jgi:hypothetical protein
VSCLLVLPPWEPPGEVRAASRPNVKNAQPPGTPAGQQEGPSPIGKAKKPAGPTWVRQQVEENGW